MELDFVGSTYNRVPRNSNSLMENEARRWEDGIRVAICTMVDSIMEKITFSSLLLVSRGPMLSLHLESRRGMRRCWVC